ncbi:Serine carboxypeptidase-like 40 [Camellia lanceoleosa]|nr:Serine carboxypeptidase-like 40 [Camellia lanceoleosa]
MYAYLNRADVQEAVHANVTKLSYDWEPCSEVTRHWEDSPSTMTPLQECWLLVVAAGCLLRSTEWCLGDLGYQVIWVIILLLSVLLVILSLACCAVSSACGLCWLWLL